MEEVSEESYFFPAVYNFFMVHHVTEELDCLHLVRFAELPINCMPSFLCKSSKGELSIMYMWCGFLYYCHLN